MDCTNLKNIDALNLVCTTITEISDVESGDGGYIVGVMHHSFSSTLLALSIGQRLCIDFSVSEANFLTTLRLDLDVIFSYYFLSNLFNVDVNYSIIYI